MLSTTMWIGHNFYQVPSIDFFENYSQVVSDIIFLVLLLMMIHFGYSAKIVNVKTAFFYGDIKEEIYMKCTQGLEYLEKAIASF